MRAAAASRAVLVGGRPKFVRELTRPFISAHHLGGNTGIGPYPDNAIESMDYLLADGETVMNYSAIQKTSDGTIVVIHDSTVDRTLNGTGTVSAMTLAAFKALRVATSKAGWPGFPDNVWPTRTFDEAVAYLGARGIHKPEANFALTGDAATYAASYTSRGLQDYAQLDTASVANATAWAAVGLTACYIVPDGTTVTTLQSQWPTTLGPVQVNYYQSSPPGGSIDTYIQALITAGYRVQVFQINRRSDGLAAIASAAAAGGVLDGIISNDPVYHDPRLWKPRTADSFATGRWPHGFQAGSGGSTPRCGMYAGARYGWGNDQTTNIIHFVLGEISPISRPFTLAFEGVIEGLSSIASTTISGVLATSDLVYGVGTGSTRRDGYYWSYNVVSGLMQLYRNTGAGATQTFLSQQASAAPAMPLKLTADLTSGVAITSLPVRAVPASIPSGIQFLLPTGQKATTSGVTAANATSVTVTSITPTALVPAGTRVPQTIPFTLQLTSTQVILKRTDTNTTLTVTDSTWGTNLYTFFGKQANGTTITFADGVTTAGSPVVTSASLAAFVLSTDEDKLLTHANIPAGTRVLSVDSATQVTLTANATASGTGLTMTLYRANNGVTYRNISVGP